MGAKRTKNAQGELSAFDPLRRCRTVVAGCTGENRPVPEGNKNAFQHGHYSAEAIARRREIAALLGNMRALAREATWRTNSMGLIFAFSQAPPPASPGVRRGTILTYRRHGTRCANAGLVGSCSPAAVDPTQWI